MHQPPFEHFALSWRRDRIDPARQDQRRNIRTPLARLSGLGFQVQSLTDRLRALVKPLSPAGHFRQVRSSPADVTTAS